VEFWTTEQRGTVAIATFSNPPRNYLVAPAIDELEQLIEEWRDPSIRAVVIQSRPEDAGFMTHYSVEELYGLISDPTKARYSAAIVRRFRGDLRSHAGTAQGHHRRDERGTPWPADSS